MKNLIRAFVLPGLVLTAIACEPQAKKDSVDERQQLVNSGNASLARMEVLKLELATAGIKIDNFVLQNSVRQTITFRSDAELLSIKLKLQDYISHGQNVLKIAARSDLAWTGRTEVQGRLTTAQTYLTQIDRRLSHRDTSLDAAFWASWNTCRTDLSIGFSSFGVSVWQNYYAYDEAEISQLSPYARQELANKIRHQIECRRTVERGNLAIFGETFYISPSLDDAPARFKMMKAEKQGLEVLAIKLDIYNYTKK